MGGSCGFIIIPEVRFPQGAFFSSFFLNTVPCSCDAVAGKLNKNPQDYSKK